MSRIYRTLVFGTLVQESALCVGGTAGEPGSPDLPCARDGKGRLTIPGSGLAGALVETAGRVFPALLREPGDPDSLWNRLSGKGWLTVATGGDDEDRSRQSLWHFQPTHRVEKTTEARQGVTTEARQGVGIRQATGTTAAEAKALYDMETTPAGTRWSLSFEVDTLRGGPEAEAVALFALWEWTQGRCWLGAAAARGLGWMRLEEVRIVRLPTTAAAIAAWPDSTVYPEDAWAHLAPLGEKHEGAEALRRLAVAGWARPLPPDRFCYLTLDAEVRAGPPDADGYGWDTLSVGGHAAGYLAPPVPRASLPEGMREEVYKEKYVPDAPVVMTGAGAGARPLLPGGGLRGPLRHAASRWRRGLGGQDVVDPNDTDDPFRFGDDPKERDELSWLFGLTSHSGRLLVRDGQAQDAGQLVWLQHHAEDEFTAGVYGSGKFDRTALLTATFKVRLVVEAPSPGELRKYVQALRPALRLAELGFVPLGGGKYRGHGWLKWHFLDVSHGPAGEPAKASKDVLPLRGQPVDIAFHILGLLEGSS